MEEKVKKVLANDIKPYLKSHGGDVKLLSVSDDGTVKIKSCALRVPGYELKSPF